MHHADAYVDSVLPDDEADEHEKYAVLTHEEVAKQLGVSRQYVHQTERSALAKLRKKPQLLRLAVEWSILRGVDDFRPGVVKMRHCAEVNERADRIEEIREQLVGDMSRRKEAL